jgi:hypothetical protein
MLNIFMIILLSIVSTENSQPAYVLEYPGLALEVLPDVMMPPVEGTLTEEAGVITSNPNADGVEYRLYYWMEDLEDNTRKDEWLSTRFRSIISPDLLPTLLIGEVEWTEGSTSSPLRETASVGLVPALSFNSIDERGNILARGRACGIFIGDYSILFYGIAPYDGEHDMVGEIDRIVSWMHTV